MSISWPGVLQRDDDERCGLLFSSAACKRRRSVRLQFAQGDCGRWSQACKYSAAEAAWRVGTVPISHRTSRDCYGIICAEFRATSSYGIARLLQSLESRIMTIGLF